MSFRKLVIGFILAVAVIFMVQNLATVETGFLWWSFRAPRVILLLLTFGAGMLVGLLLGYFPRSGRSLDR